MSLMFSRITADEVIFAYLKNSQAQFSPTMLERFSQVEDNSTWTEKMVCRELMEELGLLREVLKRRWFRAGMGRSQRARMFLGKEGGPSSNDFSRFFSEGSYRIEKAAHNVQNWEVEGEARIHHRQTVLDKAANIEASDLESIIFNVSRYTLNRKLLCFDGNHRLIAYRVRYAEFPDFSCIVGFSERPAIAMLQRILLGFPFADRLLRGLRFRLGQTRARVFGILSGGVNYQPSFADADQLKELTDPEDASVFTKYRRQLDDAERPCLDRAHLMHRDLSQQFGHIEGFSLLDIGCNIGFFCHYFQISGLHCTGVDNSRHARKQLFTLANSIDVAQRMNQRYGLAAEFIDTDVRDYVRETDKHFDVVLLLSVIHHFFYGYNMGDDQKDGMVEAHGFLSDILSRTRRCIYIEYEDTSGDLSLESFCSYLEGLSRVAEAEVFARSDDFGRPMIRCRVKQD